MKTLNLTFEESDFEKLKKVKERSKAKSWEKFILNNLPESIFNENDDLRHDKFGRGNHI